MDDAGTGPSGRARAAELHYQPVVDLRSGGIVGAEALLLASSDADYCHRASSCPWSNRPA